MSTLRIILFGVSMELCYLTFFFFPEGSEEVLLFIGVNVATFLLFAWVAWLLRNEKSSTEGSRGSIVLIVAFGVLFRLTLVPHPVVGSDDVYRYLWDGKVAASGVNPFAYVPTDPHLSHLASADLPAKVNHAELRTLYPALAEGLFFLSNKLFGESAAGLKLLLVGFDCVTMALLWALLRRHGRSPLALVLYAWSPLPIIYFGLDGHIDALGIAFLVLALLCFAMNRRLQAVVALGLSALAKLVPLILVPLLLRMDKGVRRFVFPAVPVLLVVCGYLLYYEPTLGSVESLKTFGVHWEFNGSIFSLIYFLTGSNETAHRAMAVMMVCWLGVLAFIDRPLTEKIFWGFVGFILLSPVVHPWYLTWLAALLVIRWSIAVFVFLGLSNIANIVVYQYRAFGEWNDQPLLLLIEYVPVFLLLAREIVRGEVLRSGEPGEESRDVSPGSTGIGGKPS
jgi:alpha-1,6-mannosyltransferase